MTKQDEEPTIRSILVALDASQHSLAALRAAVELASSLEAELQGLFVEDTRLLRMAGLPGVREIRYPFDATARMNRARMERQLRAQAEQARRALAAACKREQVEWTFRVVRGDVASQVLEAAKEADLLSLGKASRPITLRVRMGSTAQTAAEQVSRSVLLLPGDVDIRPPVVVSHDGSPAARRALVLAARLAQQQGRYLSILLLADTQDAIEHLKAQAADWLSGRGLMIHYRQLPSADVNTLIDAVYKEGSGVLVLSGTILSSKAVKVLLERVTCPILIIR